MSQSVATTANRIRMGALFGIPAALFVGIVYFFAAALHHDPETLPSALIGKEMPAFELPGLMPGEKALRRADLLGRPALVNFYASWCIPCREEAPTLLALARTAGVPIFGIDYKDRVEAGRQFIAAFGNPYAEIGADAKGLSFIDFGAYGVPETFLVDASGRVRFRYPGPLTQAVVDAEILPRLRALASPSPEAAPPSAKASAG